MSFAATAAGARAVAFQKLADLIATCPAFAERCSSPAIAHVSIPFHRDENQEIRPLAIIGFPDDGGMNPKFVSGGSQHWFRNRGTIQFQIIKEIDDPSPEASNDEAIDFLNFSDAIIKYVLDNAAVSDSLPTTGIVSLGGPKYSDPRHVAGDAVLKPCYVETFLLNWE